MLKCVSRSSVLTTFRGMILLAIVGACGPKGDPAVTGSGLSTAEAKDRLVVALDLQVLALNLEGYANVGDGTDQFPPVDGAGVKSLFKS